MIILKFLKPYKWLVVTLVLLIIIQVFSTLQLPRYMGKIVDQGVLAQNIGNIFYIGMLMLLFTIISAVAAVMAGYLAAKVGAGLGKDMRLAVFKHVESFSLLEFNNFSTATLITRTTNDVQQVQNLTTVLLRVMLMAPLMALGALYNALTTAPSLSWIILIAVISLIGVVLVLFSLSLPRFKRLQKTIDQLNLVTRENLTGLKVVRAFNNEKLEEEKQLAVNTKLTRLSLIINRLMLTMDPFMTVITGLTMVAILWFGAQLVQVEAVEIGSLMAFMQYAIRVVTAFLTLSMIFIMTPRAVVSAKRIKNILDVNPKIKNPPIAKKLPADGGGIVEFKNVCFKYPEASEAVLEGINFTAKPGTVTAIIGGTGSGKTTLIGLLPRFYDATSGEVLIDGVNVKELKLSDLYGQLGYVPQKSVLFSGSVWDNLTYGNPSAAKDEIEEALRIAQATHFINELDGGLQAPVVQGGDNFSGGQKQRMAIARALVVNPKIFVFDDSFSALDLKTDRSLRQELGKKLHDKTFIIVAQRINSIKNADNIIVLDKGKIVGQGTHHELLRTNSVYQEIAMSQLTQTEFDEEVRGQDE